MGAVVVALTYFFITALCVAMSAISTYHGFQTMFTALTLPVTAVVTAGLFACDIAILDKRRRGHPIWGAVLVLMLFTAFSWISNFHFFYKNFAESDLAGKRFAEATRAFDKNVADAQIAVRGEERLGEVRRAIEQDLRNLREQLDNSLKKGCGQECRKHVQDIYAHVARIPARVTPLAEPAPGAAAAVNDRFFTDIQRLVLNELVSAEKEDPWRKALASIDKERAGKADILKAVGPADRATAASYLKGINDLADATRRVDLMLAQVFSEQAKRDPSRKLVAPRRLEPTDAAGVELDSITASVNSGIYARPEPLKSIAAGLSAIFVDLMPLIFALVLIRPPRRKEDGELAEEIRPLFMKPKPVDQKRPPKLRKVQG